MTTPDPTSCAWCRGPLPAGARRDAITCSKRCRQARHRFRTGVGVAPAGTTSAPLRLAYADPPYPGLSARYYEDHRDYAGEVDHRDLIRRLAIDFDGWALSTSSRALPEVLALCPPGTRVAAWHRGERPTRSGAPLQAWEPVLYYGGRRDPDLSSVDTRHETSPWDPVAPGRRDTSRRVDSLVHFSRPRLTDPERVVGAKPAVFCRWVFDLLGALPHDDFTDVYPGSGGVLRAWHAYTGVPDHG